MYKISHLLFIIPVLIGFFNLSFKTKESLLTQKKVYMAISSGIVAGTDSIPYITYPNVFSPNNDNKNDLFYIASNQLKELHVQIYNRWGILVFEYSGVLGAWDGRTTAGQEAPAGTYFFILDGTFKDGTKIPDNKNKGSVTLLR